MTEVEKILEPITVALGGIRGEIARRDSAISRLKAALRFEVNMGGLEPEQTRRMDLALTEADAMLNAVAIARARETSHD